MVPTSLICKLILEKKIENRGGREGTVLGAVTVDDQFGGINEDNLHHRLISINPPYPFGEKKNKNN